MRGTKLELEPRTTLKELDILRELVKGLDLISELRANEDAAILGDVPRHIPKTSGEIISDYLACVSKEWYRYIRGQGEHTLDQVPLDIVITHCPHWPYDAMNELFRAVVGAFPRGMFPTLRDIYFVPEPEACALYTIQDLTVKDCHSLIPGECFVVCDASDYTVDLASYRIDSIEPFRLTRVGGISSKVTKQLDKSQLSSNCNAGGYCGARFVDREFLEFIQARVNNLDFGTSCHPYLTPMARRFLDLFEGVKNAFNGTNEGDISLPRRATIAAGYQDNMGSGVMTITEMDLKNIFKRSVKGTLDLISRQVFQVQALASGETPGEVTNIFLSGGFSENECLFNEVKRFADSRCIDVRRADDCWGGVVKGAVLKGMGIGADMPYRLRSCPRHYGVCVSQIYADWAHDSARVVIDEFHGRQVVRDQLIWLVQRGDVILPDKPVVSTFSIGYRFTPRHLELGESVRMVIVATALERPPSNLSDLPRGKEYLTCPHSLQSILECLHQGQQTYQNEVAYLDIDLKNIPKSSLQRENSPHGGNYYQVAMDAEFRVSQGVTVSCKCGDYTLGTHNMAL
ncbi:MAG: hypothetical protein M1839_008542 [Geoglossum umbratile]|nr:MAG: hypothetical protein M1839_008542 [Geoglossum umbratile]